MSGETGIRPQSRDSAESEADGPPAWCEKHEIYYGEDGCFKCKQNVKGVLEVTEEVRTVGGIPIVDSLESVENQPTVPDGTLLKPVPFGQEINAILDLGAPSAEEIIEQCLVLARFLTEKNKAYGDSALDPVRILSKADVAEQIRIRMDDKLSRLVRGELAGEDAVQDLVGYYILLKIAEKRGSR